MAAEALLSTRYHLCRWLHCLCAEQAAAAKARIGALYTFGQPRVGGEQAAVASRDVFSRQEIHAAQLKCNSCCVRPAWHPAAAVLQLPWHSRRRCSTLLSSKLSCIILHCNLLCWTSRLEPSGLNCYDKHTLFSCYSRYNTDYEFLCHLSVSLLEPAASSSSSSTAEGTAAASAGGSSSSSRLRGLWGGAGRQQEEAAGPPLTSRYIRVVNTYDIVPHSESDCCSYMRMHIVRSSPLKMHVLMCGVLLPACQHFARPSFQSNARATYRRKHTTVLCFACGDHPSTLKCVLLLLLLLLHLQSHPRCATCTSTEATCCTCR
jgi:hypothetical protein